MSCMNVLIATAEQEVYRGQAGMVVAPSAGGEIAILPGHAPLLASLRPGEVRIDCPKNDPCGDCRSDYMAVFGGFIEVQPDMVIILADSVERSEDIDMASAQEALKKAQKEFQSTSLKHVDRALLELEIAIARLRIASKGNNFINMVNHT